MTIDTFDYGAPAHANALRQWRAEAEAAAYVAKTLLGTPFIPASLIEDRNDDPERNRTATVANVAAALLTGQEVGLSPMASLRSVDIIENQPALRAITMRALVLRAGHEIELVDSTETRAVVRGRRLRGITAGELTYGEWQSSTWTIDRATKLGLVNKRNWRTQPAAMLIARATSECCRLVASDVLLALPYAAEEVGDPDELPTVTAAPSVAPHRRTARRRRPEIVAELPEPEPEPTPEPEVEATDPEPTPEPEAEAPPPRRRKSDDVEAIAAKVPPLTSGQLAALMAGFNARGIDRDERLRMASEALGRPIESFKILDRDEASMLLDGLKVADQQGYSAEFGIEAVAGEDEYDPELAEPEVLPEPTPLFPISDE